MICSETTAKSVRGRCRVHVFKQPLFWLVVIYLLVGVGYAWLSPVFEKPDEAAHYGYLRYLRQHHHLPPLDVHTFWLFESKQPPLYYTVTAALTFWLPDVADPDRLIEQNPYAELSVPGVRNDNRNLYLHPPWLPALVFGARLVSLLFGLGTVVIVYGIAQHVLGESMLSRLAAAAVVGFHPKFLYIATSVSNDAATTFFGTLVVALLILKFRHRHPRFFPQMIGVTLGLAALTKVSALVFLPLTIFTLFLIHGELNPRFFRESAIIVGVAVVVGGGWYVRNALLYQDPFTLQAHLVQGQGTRHLISRLWRDLLSIERTFWSNQAPIFLSSIWIDRLAIGWGRLSLILVIVCAALRRGCRNRLTLIFAVWSGSFLLLLLLFWTHRAAFVFGRLLFPILTPFMLLLLQGWAGIVPKTWSGRACLLAAGPIIVAGLWVPVLTLYPIYHPYRKIREPDLAYPVDAVYTEDGRPVVELLGYNLPDRSALPGDYVPVELCWKTDNHTSEPYALFVHLLAPNVAEPEAPPIICGARRTYPGLGNLPSDRWPLHQSYCETVRVQVAPQCPTPSGTQLEIGFFRPDTEERLLVYDSEGRARDIVQVKGLSVVSPDSLAPALLRSEYTLGGDIALLDWRHSTSADSSVTLTTTWQMQGDVEYDAIIFSTFQDASGEIIAQHDHQPLHGQYPTSYWVTGQIVTDVVALQSSRPLTDQVTLNLGMYTLPDVSRLNVLNKDNTAVVNDVIRLPLDSGSR